MIDVSVIIVSYNTRDLLHKCLASVTAGLGELCSEILVVDNASSDGSVDMVERDFPSVQLIRSDSNRGFAVANNIAMEQASGRYMILLNSDTEVTEEAVPKLVHFMDEHPAVGYCGPQLVNRDGSHQASARRFPTVLSAAYSILGLTRRYPDSRHSLDLHVTCGKRSEFKTDWVSGACLAARAEAACQVGRLDEGFFLYFEETDWCQRMAKAGWEGWFVGTAEVVHLGGQSVAEDGAGKPFSGDHPVHWINSRRRYMRRYHGLLGMILSEVIQITLYSAIWLRHRWRRGQQSRTRAKSAAMAIRYILAF